MRDTLLLNILPTKNWYGTNIINIIAPINKLVINTNTQVLNISLNIFRFL